MSELGALFTKHGSDKNTSHSYGAVYDELLSSLRMSVRCVLEVGVLGGGSLRAWEEYFPLAFVIGIDNNSVNIQEGHRHITLIADATNVDQVNNILGERRFDLIVDDGSHWEEDQIKTWKILFPRLLPGGVYVVEDIQHISSWDKFRALGGQIRDLREQRPGQFDNVLGVWKLPG